MPELVERHQLSYAAIPVGQLSVGPLASAFGGFRVATVAGVVYVAAAVFPLAFKPVRSLTHTAQPAPGEPSPAPQTQQGQQAQQGSAPAPAA